jgi:protoporphyrin/coproporphyrin ferrochelatase
MKTAVLLVNYGGPRTIDEVSPFLKNMMGDAASAAAIGAVAARYRAIGGGSPLAAITEQLAQLLSKHLPEEVRVRTAFRYSSPNIEERINEYHDAGIERILCVAMSPFYSSRTVGVYETAARACLERSGCKTEVEFVHSWYDKPAFLDAWISKVREEMTQEEDSYYLFSAHSLPLSLASEPYESQIERTSEAVAAATGLSNRYTVVWQSVPRGAKEAWIGPSPEEAMDGLEGMFRHVVEVPIGFLNDHLETLYDMDITHRQYAEAKGLHFSRISSLNLYPPFVHALALIIEGRLRRRAS